MTKPIKPKKGRKPVVKPEETVEDRLSAIYRDDAGALPEFDQLDRRRSFWWLRATVWIVLAACVITGLAWLGFLLWRPWKAEGPALMAIKIDVPATIAPGEEQTVRVHWENADIRPLHEANIRIFLPTDFVLNDASPAPTTSSSHTWSLGLVPPRQQGDIELHGIFYGSADRHASIQALVTYRSEALDRDRELAETAHLTYTTSTIDGVLMAPDRIVPGDQVVIRYQVTNHSDQSLGPLLARFSLPEGFVVSASSSPGLNQDGPFLTFPIARLPSGSMTMLQVSGSMLAGHAGDASLVAAVGRTDIQGLFVPLQMTERRAVVLAGDLALHLIVNGSDGNTTLEPDAPLRVTVGYENTSGAPLKNIALMLSVETAVNGKKQTGQTGLIDWQHLEDVQRAATSTKGQTQTLVLSAAQVPSFALVPPGAKGSFDWILPLRSAPTGTHDAVVQLAASVHIERVGDATGTRDVRVTPLMLAYKTDADLAVEARYSTEEGAPLGFGPLPPQVAKTTGYQVTWTLTKKLHELDHVVARATLPAIATWNKSVRVDRGTLRYTTSTREIRWEIPTVPLNAASLTAAFDVQITPEKADAGRFAPILSETTFEAHDTQISYPLSRVKPSLTSDLPNDDLAHGHGVVR